MNGDANPLAFSSLNVALYGQSEMWSLRERHLTMNDRSATAIAFGQSHIEWQDDALVVTIDERTTPFGRRVRGRITLRPEIMCNVELSLDRAKQHRWWPIAPLARIEVDLDGARFQGHGYHDANMGEVPLEASFDRWSWSRARIGRHARLTYAVAESNGERTEYAFDVDPVGEITSRPVPVATCLPRTGWGIDRTIHSSGPTRLLRTLEDGPFYTRSLVEADGTVTMHEELSAERLRKGWVRFLTGFRMGKAA